MYAHVKDIAVVVNQAQRLLMLAVGFDGFETVETADAVVDVGDIVAGFQLVKFFQGEGLFGAVTVAQVETVVTFKDLVVGVAAHFQIVVDKSAVDGVQVAVEVLVVFGMVLQVVQNGLDAVELLGAFGIQNQAVAVLFAHGDVFDKQVEVLVENRLWQGVESNVVCRPKLAALS